MFLLKRYHDDPDSGEHDGIFRTYIKIMKRFGNRRPNIRDEVTAYLRSCDTCQLAKFKFKPKHEYLVLAIRATFPFHTIHLDI